MKISSSIANSPYPKFESLSAKGKETHSPNHFKRKSSGQEIDKVDLRIGLSLERIQDLLTTSIGKKVDKMMASAEIDITTAAGLDWSPDATSGRIFGMTTGLFGVWRDQHSDMSEEELIDSFEKVIRSSADQGASEAMAILSSSGFGEQTSSVAQDTMSLLHQKYDDYFAGLREELEQSQSTSNQEAEPAN